MLADKSTCHRLVTRHKVWINNWIYWMLKHNRSLNVAVLGSVLWPILVIHIGCLLFLTTGNNNIFIILHILQITAACSKSFWSAVFSCTYYLVMAGSLLILSEGHKPGQLSLGQSCSDVWSGGHYWCSCINGYETWLVPYLSLSVRLLPSFLADMLSL